MKPEAFVLIVFTLISNCLCYDRQIRGTPKQLWNETYVDKLRNDLLTNYDKYARPEQHYEVTTVKITLPITYVIADELNSTITVGSYLKLGWSDSKMKWNPDDYGGVDSVRFDNQEIWTPSIYLYNRASLNSEAINHYQNTYAFASSGGDMFWVPPVTLTALCKFDLYYWPFDTQNCYLKFVSWSRNGKDIKLEISDTPDTVEEVPAKWISAWEISKTGEVYTDFKECCTNSFYVAQFNVTMQRNSNAYVAMVFVPAIAVVMLLLVQCWLPFYSGQRITLNCCTSIIVTILLTHFLNKIYSADSKTPLIVSFYSTSLFITCFSIIESIFVQLLHNKCNSSLPGFINKHLKGKLGKILLLEDYNSQLIMSGQTVEEMKECQGAEDEDKGEESDKIIRSNVQDTTKLEWNVFIMALDRIVFIIFVFVFLVLALLCLI